MRAHSEPLLACARETMRDISGTRGDGFIAFHLLKLEAPKRRKREGARGRDFEERDDVKGVAPCK